MNNSPATTDNNKCKSESDFFSSLDFSYIDTTNGDVLHAEQIAMWEDEIDALGSNPSDEDLQRMIDCTPNKSNPLFIFATGVMAQRTMNALK